MSVEEVSEESETTTKDQKGQFVDSSAVNVWIGRGLLSLAACLVCLFFVDYTSEAGLPLPAVWYKMQPFFLLLTIACFIASWFLMKAEPVESSRKKEKPIFETLNFYSRPGCSLCEEAYLLLSRYQPILPEIKVINIENNPDLLEKFTSCVPVIEIDGKVRFRGKVNPVLFQRLIDATLERLAEDTTD